MKTLAMFAAMVIGFFCPWAEAFNFLIPWLIVVMMFLAMLRMKISFRSFRPAHLRIFAVNILIALGAWGIMLMTQDQMLAETAFYLGVAPTATATPVVVTLLGGRGDYAIGSFVITNFGVALLLPLLIPLVSGSDAPSLFFSVVRSVLLLVCGPLVAARIVAALLKEKLPSAAVMVRVSFVIWIINVFLIIANASAYVRSRSAEISTSTFVIIALMSLLICALNFFIGRFLDKPGFRLEASQSLGQKNTSLTLFLAFQYAMNPLVALGPAFYVAWHNTWNAIQLALAEREKKHHTVSVTLEKSPPK